MQSPVENRTRLLRGQLASWVGRLLRSRADRRARSRQLALAMVGHSLGKIARLWAASSNIAPFLLSLLKKLAIRSVQNVLHQLLGQTV